MGAVSSVALSAPEAPKFNALLQAWTVDNTTVNVNPQLNFRLRRAELKVSGTIVPEARYFAMIDGAKVAKGNDNRILQDLGIAFTFLPGLEVTAGQFKTPTTAEGLLSSSELLFPERSRTGRTYGDRREPGLMITYQTSQWKWIGMLSNGQGPNANATTNTKDLTLRSEFTINPDLRVGAFVLLGDLAYNNKGSWGTNFRYARENSLTLLGEYVMGKTGPVVSQALVVESGYFVSNQVQPGLRYEILQPNLNSGFLAQQPATVLNYYIAKHSAKLQASLSYLSNMTGNDGAPDVVAGSYGTQWTIAFQAAL